MNHYGLLGAPIEKPTFQELNFDKLNLICKIREISPLESNYSLYFYICFLFEQIANMCNLDNRKLKSLTMKVVSKALS